MGETRGASTVEGEVFEGEFAGWGGGADTDIPTPININPLIPRSISQDNVVGKSSR